MPRPPKKTRAKNLRRYGDGDAVSSGETTFFKVCDIKFGVLGVDDEGEDVISGFVLGFSGKEDSFFGNGLLC